MTQLSAFNQATAAEARAMLTHCVAIPDWQAELVLQRPFASLEQLLQSAEQLALRWGSSELEQALSAHPRIGEKALGSAKEATLSRSEQAQVNLADAPLSEALRQGNSAYEQRFGQVFLIRAKGRSGAQMLAELQRRLQNSPPQEQREALEQLREITLLRLKETFL